MNNPGSLGNNGIFIIRTNFTNISNSDSSGNLYGIYLDSSSNNRLADNTAYNNTNACIVIKGSSNNTINDCDIKGNLLNFGALEIYTNAQNNTVANSRINGNGGVYAVSILSGANIGNAFINDTFLNDGTLAYLDGEAGANTFCWNNFTDTAGYYVLDLNGTNRYNSSLCNGEGNIWANVMNGTVEISGTANSSGFPGLFVGNSQYDDSSSLGKVSGVTDHAPLTNNFSSVSPPP